MAPNPKDYVSCGMYGLFVNREGEFFRNGNPKKVRKSIRNGRKLTSYIWLKDKNKQIYIPAMQLVAKAFVGGYREGMYVVPKDGNLHNIAADNIEIIREDQYKRWFVSRLSKRIRTIGRNIEKIDTIITEASMVRRYMDSRDFAELTDYFKETLIPSLKDFCINGYKMGETKTIIVISEVISLIYEKISFGYPMYAITEFAKSRIREWRKTGKLGKPYYINRDLFENHIDKLKLDCLCEKFKK